MERINWDQVVEQVKISLKWFQNHDVLRPILRTIYYRLVSLQVIPNTKHSYKSLSAAMVRARKSGEIPWDCFSDRGREVLVGFDGEYTSPEEFIQSGINYLQDAPYRYLYTIPRWHNQKHHVEVWIEKQALADTFQSFLEDRQVNIVVNKGYAGWSFLFENCERLRMLKDRYNKDIHVLYFGDFDPSGEDMDRHLRTVFEQFGLQDQIAFRRAAVTLDQIGQFNLPPIPDNHETLDKLKNDTRLDGFRERYGRVYAVELDAMLAIAPGDLRALVRESVDQYFDEHAHKDVLRKHPSERIDRLVRQK